MKLFYFSVFFTLIFPFPSHGLPPESDTPEEVLSTEIIVEGRSYLDNSPLSASEYAELEAEKVSPRFATQLADEVRHNIFLLQLLKMFKTLTPL
ncbi:MAG: hypothetical protein IGQ45_07095 [Cyanobacterium sp. T60_A2020_053]|nr:hypothetical protein [Cyanobacterium sp. T60_A2020_053]